MRQVVIATVLTILGDCEHLFFFYVASFLKIGLRSYTFFYNSEQVLNLAHDSHPGNIYYINE